MIDLPEGAVGRIAGNTFVQGNGKENYGTLIAVHAEDGRQSVRRPGHRGQCRLGRARLPLDHAPSSATGAARRW